uniref:Reverse transcriptase domain-containing protein n=1 Tax=Neogobius melanostomus TaxID=47308 RepID=A0A8C6WYX0_9GOBI
GYRIIEKPQEPPAIQHDRPNDTGTDITEDTPATTGDPSEPDLNPSQQVGSRTRFKGRSTFIPPHRRNASIDTYCRLVEQDVSHLLNNKRKYTVSENLTKEQRLELNLIQKDNSIVIKSADKGGAIVILDRSTYVNEVQRQLCNTNFYRKLDHNPTSTFKSKIKNKLDSLLLNNEITKSEHAFMYVDSPVTPVLYILPKIHKQYTDAPPGRPIVSSIGSLTEKISAFIDHTLQPLVTSLPSYIRDSMEFLKMLKTIVVPESCLLVTMDIESLYTHVPFEGGLRASEFFLN